MLEGSVADKKKKNGNVTHYIPRESTLATMARGGVLHFFHLLSLDLARILWVIEKGSVNINWTCKVLLNSPRKLKQQCYEI